MIRILGAFLAVLFTVCAMYLSAIGAGMTFRAFFDLISFFICFGIPYGCALAAYGKAIPDLKGMELMNKLFMPVAWLGTLIGWVMMLYSMSMGTSEIENMYARLSLYTAITTITLLYGLILKVIFTTLIASKK